MTTSPAATSTAAVLPASTGSPRSRTTSTCASATQLYVVDGAGA